MAPAADMFSSGVKLQVVRTPFVGRATRLYEMFVKYDDMNHMNSDDATKFNRILGESPETVWEQTKEYYKERLNDMETIARAEKDVPTEDADAPSPLWITKRMRDQQEWLVPTHRAT